MAKILVVDDDPDFVNAAKIILESNHHDVIAAANGDAGYQRARDDRPDLVILDVIMDTILAGLSVSRRMHEDADLVDIPVIMVTSIANSDYAELFPTDEYIHINAFLSKPISPDELIRQVNKYLPKSKTG